MDATRREQGSNLPGRVVEAAPLALGGWLLITRLVSLTIIVRSHAQRTREQPPRLHCGSCSLCSGWLASDYSLSNTKRNIQNPLTEAKGAAFQFGFCRLLFLDVSGCVRLVRCAWINFTVRITERKTVASHPEQRGQLPPVSLGGCSLWEQLPPCRCLPSARKYKTV